MDELKRQHNEAVLNAWNSICDWCKKNLAEKVPGGMVVHFPFTPYVWKAFAVTQEGDVQLHIGPHGNSSEYVYLRDRQIEFALLSCCSRDDSIYSHFYDNDKKPHRTNEQYARGGKRGIMLCSHQVSLDRIEDVVFQWQSLKAELLQIVENENKLKNFQV
jgi:hypothetical protein